MNESVINLVPKDKFDISGIKSLEKLSYTQIKPVLPELLEWIQDMNWPVAQPIFNLLGKHINRLTNEVVPILKGNDDQWKYWVLCLYGLNPTVVLNTPIIDEVNRIIAQPTVSEQENYLVVESKVILVNSTLSKLGVYIFNSDIVLLKRSGKHYKNIPISEIHEIGIEPFAAPLYHKALFWIWRYLQWNLSGYDYEIVNDNTIDHRIIKELVIDLNNGTQIRKQVVDYNKGELNKTIVLLDTLIREKKKQFPSIL